LHRGGNWFHEQARAASVKTVHELSIATNIIEAVADHLREAGGGEVAAVTLRIGRLSCVHEDALRFSFDLVREGTPLAAAELRVIDVAVAIWCSSCRAEVELPGIQSLACPACGTTSGEIRRGRELDLESIELAGPAADGKASR
jgi:hydrogenase nickel incorporation protein HypA/HybF